MSGLKISVQVTKDFMARIKRAQVKTAIRNKSEFIRVLVDESLKARGE
jgi:hypothetical protein